jgi:vacuolar-type H+-ATPase subunit H
LDCVLSTIDVPESNRGTSQEGAVMPERETDQTAQDIVDRILATEQHMEKTLQGAREEAQAVKSNAEKESSRIMSKAKAEAQDLIRDAVREAEESAARERQHQLDQEEQRTQSILHRRAGEVDEFVSRVADMILSTGIG